MTNDAERVSDIVAWRWRFKTAYSNEYIDWCVSAERCPEDRLCRGFDGFEEQALYTADIIEAQSKALAEAREALKPFADRVFNDNGDMSVSGGGSFDDYVRAYFIVRRTPTPENPNG